MPTYELKQKTKDKKPGYVVINTQYGYVCNGMWFPEADKKDAESYRDMLELFYGVKMITRAS